MRGIFWSIAMAIGVGGAFLSGIVLPNDREGAPPNRSLVEGPAYPDPPGWSCEGNNWIFFDRECSRHRRHRHHHHPLIVADGKASVEARREPRSPDGEAATRPEMKVDARRIRPEHGRPLNRERREVESRCGYRRTFTGTMPTLRSWHGVEAGEASGPLAGNLAATP
jgi:hypothetical protein